MKKLMLIALALLLTVALAGCGEKNEVKTGVGNFYENYTTAELDNGDLQITAEAHVDDVLSAGYFYAEEATTLGVELTLNSTRGDCLLYYVPAEGEEICLSGYIDYSVKMPSTTVFSVELTAGESRLEWRSENGGELEYEMTISNAEDVLFAMFSAEEQAQWDAMLDALNNQAEIMGQLEDQLGDLAEQNGVTITGVPNSDSISLRGMDKQLAVGEPAELLQCAPAGEYLLPIKAALWDFSGDVQLYYVPLDGEEQLLWDSNVQAVSEPPLYFENPWEYVLPEEIDTAEVLPLEVTAVLQPGEGRLEWRSENGAEFKINMLVEDFGGLGANSLGL